MGWGAFSSDESPDGEMSSREEVHNAICTEWEYYVQEPLGVTRAMLEGYSDKEKRQIAAAFGSRVHSITHDYEGISLSMAYTEGENDVKVHSGGDIFTPTIDTVRKVLNDDDFQFDLLGQNPAFLDSIVQDYPEVRKRATGVLAQAIEVYSPGE